MATDKQRQIVLEWAREAPFDDIRLQAARPNFSYEKWFEEGRRLPLVTEALTELLESEDLRHPSGDGMRLAYALGWVGSRGPRPIAALVRTLGSKDLMLRMEAIAALGRIGDSTVVPLLEALLKNSKEDVNVRGNACISLGRLGQRSSEKVLREALTDSNPFIASCAEEGLKLLVSRPNAPQ